jgi:hypothetical protein
LCGRIVKPVLNGNYNFVSMYMQDGRTALQIAKNLGKHKAIDALKKVNEGILFEVHTSYNLSFVSFWPCQ